MNFSVLCYFGHMQPREAHLHQITSRTSLCSLIFPHLAKLKRWRKAP